MAKQSLTNVEKAQILKALEKFAAAAQELSNVIEEVEYVSGHTPDYLTELDDVAYDITSWFQDEQETFGEIVKDDLPLHG